MASSAALARSVGPAKTKSRRMSFTAKIALGLSATTDLGMFVRVSEKQMADTLNVELFCDPGDSSLVQQFVEAIEEHTFVAGVDEDVDEDRLRVPQVITGKYTTWSPRFLNNVLAPDHIIPFDTDTLEEANSHHVQMLVTRTAHDIALHLQAMREATHGWPETPSSLDPHLAHLFDLPAAGTAAQFGRIVVESIMFAMCRVAGVRVLMDQLVGEPTTVKHDCLLVRDTQVLGGVLISRAGDTFAQSCMQGVVQLLALQAASGSPLPLIYMVSDGYRFALFRMQPEALERCHLLKLDTVDDVRKLVGIVHLLLEAEE